MFILQLSVQMKPWKWCRKDCNSQLEKTVWCFLLDCQQYLTQGICKESTLVRPGVCNMIHEHLPLSSNDPRKNVAPQQHTRSYLNVWGKLGLIKLASMSWRTHTMCVMPCVSRIGSWMKTKGKKSESQDFFEAPLMKCCEDLTLLFIAAE